MVSVPGAVRGSFPVITGAASACPPSRTQEQLWDGFFTRHFQQSRLARRVFMSTGVRNRHCAVDPTQEDVSSWTTGRRMTRYLDEGVPLATNAVARALAAADRSPRDIGLLAVVSCTGYATPGVDHHLAAKLGFPASLQRLFIGHMGCYAAVPGLGAVADYVTARQQPAVLVCVELASLHVQPPTADMEQIVAHALFSDAASAVVMEPAAGRPGGGLALVDITACTVPEAASLITWSVTDAGFRMTLDRRVPDVLAAQVGPAMDDRWPATGCSAARWRRGPSIPAAPGSWTWSPTSWAWPMTTSPSPAASWPSTATAPRRPCCSCSASFAAARWRPARRWSRWRSGPA